jgi:hypothetical protein
MPSLSFEFLEQLAADLSDYRYFVETGTHEGATALAMESYFRHVYTIELSPECFRRARRKYVGDNITFILGDSVAVLHDLLPRIAGPCIFFLDGHWSSGDTGRRDVDVPLLQEIEKISKLFLHKAIIIIDDFRLFGTHGAEDWSRISKSAILDILKPRLSKVYHLSSNLARDDRLIIHIN